MNKKDKRHTGMKYTTIYDPVEEPYEEEVPNGWSPIYDNKDRTLYHNSKHSDKHIDKHESLRAKRKNSPRNQR